MSTKPPGAPAPLVTAAKSFRLVSFTQKELLSVNPGIEVDDAQDEAASFVSTIEYLLLGIVQDHDVPQIWAAIYFAQIIKAVIDASIAGLQREAQQ